MLDVQKIVQDSTFQICIWLCNAMFTFQVILNQSY